MVVPDRDRPLWFLRSHLLLLLDFLHPIRDPALDGFVLAFVRSRRHLVIIEFELQLRLVLQLLFADSFLVDLEQLRNHVDLLARRVNWVLNKLVSEVGAR